MALNPRWRRRATRGRACSLARGAETVRGGRGLKRKRGHSLIELMFASALMGICLLGVLAREGGQSVSTGDPGQNRFAARRVNHDSPLE